MLDLVTAICLAIYCSLVTSPVYNVGSMVKYLVDTDIKFRNVCFVHISWFDISIHMLIKPPHEKRKKTYIFNPYIKVATSVVCLWLLCERMSTQYMLYLKQATGVYTCKNVRSGSLSFKRLKSFIFVENKGNIFH